MKDRSDDPSHHERTLIYICFKICQVHRYNKESFLVGAQSWPSGESVHLRQSISEALWIFSLKYSRHFELIILFVCVKTNNHTNNRKEGNVLLMTHSYLRLYRVEHMVKDHSNSERGNPLPPHTLLFPVSSKGSFICIIPHTG